MNARQERILTTLFQMAKDNRELRMKAQKFASNSNSEEIKKLYVDTMLHSNHDEVVRKRKK